MSRNIAPLASKKIFFKEMREGDLWRCAASFCSIKVAVPGDRRDFVLTLLLVGVEGGVRVVAVVAVVGVRVVAVVAVGRGGFEGNVVVVGRGRN